MTTLGEMHPPSDGVGVKTEPNSQALAAEASILFADNQWGSESTP